MSSFQLSALLAAALFFAMAGLRELRREEYHGLFYIALSIFFLCAHGFLLWNSTQNIISVHNLGIWQWLIKFMAPALIVLFLVIGTFGLLTARIGVALIKILFGASLICCLFLLGAHWPADIQGILVLLWSGLWFKMELKTAV